MRKKNDEWILKCVETSLSKVLILDERLWNNNCFYTPPKVNRYATNVIDYIEKQIADPKIEEFNESALFETLNLEGNVSEMKCIELKNLIKIYNMDEIVDNANPALYEEFRNELEKIFLPESEEKFNVYVPTSFELNGITICNIKNQTNGQVEMMDLFSDPLLRIKNILTPHKIEIEFDLTNKASRFHYVSIHQGILDKIFNYYVELAEESNLSNRLNKEDYIPLILKGIKQDISPNKLSIHSGRSRPYILPDGVSFIPFSGIEYGISESKQVLLNIILSAENDIKK